MKTDGRRVARAEREVQAAVADLLLKDFRDELPGLVSVSRVQMPADLRTARVYVTAYNASPEQQKEIVQFLQKRSGEFQRHLASRISMKFCPKLSFENDKNTERVLKIDRLLEDLAKNGHARSEEDDE